MKTKRVVVYGALAVAGALLVGSVWPELVSRAAYAVQKGQAEAAREQLKKARDLSLAFQDVVTAITPSVVSIRSIARVRAGDVGPVFPGPMADPFWDQLREWFEQRGEMMPDTPRREGFVDRGMGSGVIVSKEGHILTNNHVVAGADRVSVTLSDDRIVDAKVIGRDALSDLAVVKIDVEQVLPAKLGDSDAVNVGEWVLAMGSPFGLRQTASAGIISAKGRAILDPDMFQDFIQTDAAINPGNSGGPLINLDGEVIGINTAIATRTGGYQGIGFAIPSNLARQVMDSIIKGGKVVRGQLGVVIQNLSRDMAASFDYTGEGGVLVADVPEDGPAARAGLEPGDIIVRFDGKAVQDVNRLRNRVAATAPGTKVEVEIYRDGKMRTIEVEVSERKDQAVATEAVEEESDLGMELQDLTPQMARRFRIDAEERGALVVSVEPGGLAERVGLIPGDLIISVGGKKVRSAGEFLAAIRRSDLNEGVRLRVKTEGRQRFVLLKR